MKNKQIGKVCKTALGRLKAALRQNGIAPTVEGIGIFVRSKTDAIATLTDKLDKGWGRNAMLVRERAKADAKIADLQKRVAELLALSDRFAAEETKTRMMIRDLSSPGQPEAPQVPTPIPLLEGTPACGDKS